MGIIGGQIGCAMLRFIAPAHKYSSSNAEEEQEQIETKLELFFGANFFDLIKNKIIIDFGCGMGNQSVQMAQNGALKVIGIDIQEHFLEHGRRKAKQLNLSERCVFKKSADELADIIVSKDAFEHFSSPEVILELMSTLLKPGGYVLAGFGPT